MSVYETVPNGLNEQQLLMLRLFKQPMAADDFSQIRRLAVSLLARQLDKAVEEWEAENNITEKSYEHFANEHFRSSFKNL